MTALFNEDNDYQAKKTTVILTNSVNAFSSNECFNRTNC